LVIVNNGSTLLTRITRIEMGNIHINHNLPMRSEIVT
jgi:hypothetical protein